ncbi:MAG: Fic family protein [Akkermansiaceae bacterium]|jgi:hypothetical protein|nr:Fic family protein [Akkermansiaceae bacterium]
MPKRIPPSELTPILDIVTAAGGPVSLEIITRSLPEIPRRTLQRRLALLTEKGQLAATSTRGGRRYRLGDGTPLPKNPAPSAPGGVPLTSASREIKERVSRAIRDRKVVGYHAPFPEYYRPNASAYLSTEIRRKLMQIGRTSPIPLPPGTYFRKEASRLLPDLAWNSSRIAGCGLTLEETRALLEMGIPPPDGKPEEAQILLNHKAAIQFIARDTSLETAPGSLEAAFDRHTLCNLHALLSDNLLPDPASGGRLRGHPIEVRGSTFHPLKIPALIESRFDELLAKAAAIEDPFEQSFFALVHLSYLQPFEWLNERVARLVATLPFVRHNLIPLTYVDVLPTDYLQGMLGVYELNRIDLLRDVFVWAYERSCARYSAIRRSLGEPDPFRLRHRDWLIAIIGEIVSQKLSPEKTISMLLEKLPALQDPDDQNRAPGVIQAELDSLHEGNIARYQIHPEAFRSWQELRKDGLC